jgi:hypothetical protein
MCLNYGFVWGADSKLSAAALRFMDKVAEIEKKVLNEEAELSARYRLSP